MLGAAAWLAIIIGALWCLPPGPAAQPTDRDPAPDMPRAGPAPVDDGLPRLSDEERARAAVLMLLVVSASLVAVVVLLRWFAKVNQEAVERATREQDMVDKTMDALERFEEQEDDSKRDAS